MKQQIILLCVFMAIVAITAWCVYPNDNYVTEKSDAHYKKLEVIMHEDAQYTAKTNKMKEMDKVAKELRMLMLVTGIPDNTPAGVRNWEQIELLHEKLHTLIIEYRNINGE